MGGGGHGFKKSDPTNLLPFQTILEILIFVSKNNSINFVAILDLYKNIVAHLPPRCRSGEGGHGVK